MTPPGPRSRELPGPASVAAEPSGSRLARGVRGALFPLYVTSIIAAGFSLLAHELLRHAPRELLGPFPAAFVVFAACLVAAELRPMNWLSLQDGGEVTASWTFALALLFIAPSGGGLAVMAAACLLADLVKRKPIQRALFNAAQVILSLAVGVWCFELITDRNDIVGDRWAIVWLLGTLLAAGVAFLLNSVLTCVVLALHQNMPIWPVIRTSIGVNLMMDGLLLALAPIFAVIAVHALVLVPMLLLTVWVIYGSAVLALRNRHEATHDLLTGIPNRRYFEEQAAMSLEAARRTREEIGLLHLDLDGFKGINDRLGHHYGDLVLEEVARRLSAAKRPTDMVARLGGDEFAVLLRRLAGPDDARAAAKRLLDAIVPPMIIEGLPLTVGGSFGVATFPTHGEDFDTLLHNADLAMYRAKTDKLGVVVFEADEEYKTPARLSLLAELTEAIAADELFLVYQPRIDLRTGQVISVEALVRWNHRVHGTVLPGAFMSQAEQTDIMDVLTPHICRMAIRQCVAWHHAGSHIGVTINASARNLHDLRFPQTLAQILREEHLDPGWVELEITENTVMTDPVRSASVLGHLRSIGVTTSIDDFGTGYSSLATLRRLTIDWIKIDRSFVSGMTIHAEDLMIVRSIIDLARNLGLRTVAEGVERDEEVALLRAMNCDAAQGYLLGRPMRASDIEQLLQAGAPVAAALSDSEVTPP